MMVPRPRRKGNVTDVPLMVEHSKETYALNPEQL